MTRDEAIAYGKEQLEIFGGTHLEFILMAIEALEQYEMAYEHGWTDAESKYREILERKRGEWIDQVVEDELLAQKCSVCGYLEYVYGRPNYCSNCGAEMRGEKDGV